MNKKLWIIIGVVLVAAMFLWLRQSRESADPRPVVTIGFSMPLSGDSAKFGRAARHAVELFMQDFDATAAHYRYKVIFEDNRFQSTVAATGAHKMIAAGRANAIVSLAAHIGGAINPIAERAGVIHISASIDPGVARGDYNFTIISSARRHAQRSVQHLRDQGVKTIDIVHEISSGQLVSLDALKDEMGSTEIKIRNMYPVTRGERNFRPILQRIASTSPDMILVQFFEPEIAIFLRQYHQSGMTIPLFSDESFSFLEDKTLAEGLYYVANAPASDDFAGRYEQLAGSAATDYAEYMHAIMQILTMAFESNPDRVDNADAARTILEKTDGLQTTIGRVTIHSDGVIDAPAALRKIENGKPVTVK
ncbi:MAG: ABC transporter substrate-binding protein [Alphaproteobacteria bacterium]|nr:ABC transporter substrate-binding protein [Alphaproteobacteria bacterium]